MRNRKHGDPKTIGEMVIVITVLRLQTWYRKQKCISQPAQRMKKERDVRYQRWYFYRANIFKGECTIGTAEKN